MLSQAFSKIISQIKGGNDIMRIPFSPPDITEKELQDKTEAELTFSENIKEMYIVN